jgi:isocitrate/isopropylmalate dehydrogenase
MRLVRDPGQFDVLLTGNLFGDIVSDLSSGLGGGISASPSMSSGDDVWLFENPHGDAPDLVGTGQASPIPMLRPAILMLRHLGENDAADRIRGALDAALLAGLRTVDLGGEAGCDAVRDAIVLRL